MRGKPWAACLGWLCICKLLTSCASVPTEGQITAALPPEPPEERSAIVQASHEEIQPAHETPERDAVFAPVGNRTFPQQGWWCGEFDEWLAAERLEKGYTLVLPGIEGTSFFNISIARGLVDAGHESAIEVVDWTTGNWLMFPYHLMALERNKARAREIADRIVAYQRLYPGRPVNLVGHSGGAAMTVLVLEALPPDHPIENAVLLAAALSPDYDLCGAFLRTKHGITNFYSGGDAIYLIAGTLALGTIDRQYAASAGAIGFQLPRQLTDADREKYEDQTGRICPPTEWFEGNRRLLYDQHLHQVPYRAEMLKSFHLGGHFGPANRRFVADWVAPRLASTGN
jgi:pimeloyl-ACP methyl ester carboxylesterase